VTAARAFDIDVSQVIDCFTLGTNSDIDFLAAEINDLLREAFRITPS
jgi:hypothetical protein